MSSAQITQAPASVEVRGPEQLAEGGRVGAKLRDFVASGDADLAHCQCFFASPQNARGADYMRWNTQGCSFFHSDPQAKGFASRLADVLPELPKPYPFVIGITGYIEVAESPGHSGKAKDDLGRNVFIVRDWIIFQRYVEGDRYMIKSWRDVEGPNSYYQELAPERWPYLIAESSAEGK